MSTNLVKHRKTVDVADNPLDNAKLQPGDWGSTHTDYDTAPTHIFSGGSNGQLMLRDTSDPSGFSYTGRAFIVDSNPTVIKTLVLGGEDNPANFTVEYRGANSLFGFKNAANTILYGFLGTGLSNLSSLSGFRIGSNTGHLIINENGLQTVLGGPLNFGNVLSATAPQIRRSSLELRFRTSDDSAYTPTRHSDIYANQNSGGTGLVYLGGLDADRSFGGLWIGSGTPSFSNYCILGAIGSSASQLLFNTPSSSGLTDLEFRIANNTRFTIGSAGVSINGTSNAAPTVPLLINATDKTTLRMSLTDAGQLRVVGLGGFAAGDKYVVIDANGNFHISALGPAS